MLSQNFGDVKLALKLVFFVVKFLDRHASFAAVLKLADRLASEASALYGRESSSLSCGTRSVSGFKMLALRSSSQYTRCEL